MNLLRTPGALRAFFVLASLSLVLQLAGTWIRPLPAKDKFDFAGAICSTATPAPVAANDPLPAPGHPAHAEHDCVLCCGATGCPVVADRTVLPAFNAQYLSPPAVPEKAPHQGRASWAPQAARAPPQSS